MDAPTFSEYVELGFIESKADFEASVQPAKALVDRIVGPNQVTDDNRGAYVLAICAAVKSLCDYGDGPAQSVRLGAFSMTAEHGTSGPEIAERNAMNILVPAGLAFMGV